MNMGVGCSDSFDPFSEDLEFTTREKCYSESCWMMATYFAVWCWIYLIKLYWSLTTIFTITTFCSLIYLVEWCFFSRHTLLPLSTMKMSGGQISSSKLVAGLGAAASKRLLDVDFIGNMVVFWCLLMVFYGNSQFLMGKSTVNGHFQQL